MTLVAKSWAEDLALPRTVWMRTDESWWRTLALVRFVFRVCCNACLDGFPWSRWFNTDPKPVDVMPNIYQREICCFSVLVMHFVVAC
mmetsp:Transcript_53235/g.171741  ORF Transcript_53235/g.171741 Transcript_53235/m.171741 type:complete len:87 (+) Transcript_53235:528-788(+)